MNSQPRFWIRFNPSCWNLLHFYIKTDPSKDNGNGCNCIITKVIIAIDLRGTAHLPFPGVDPLRQPVLVLGREANLGLVAKATWGPIGKDLMPDINSKTGHWIDVFRYFLMISYHIYFANYIQRPIIYWALPPHSHPLVSLLSSPKISTTSLPKLSRSNLPQPPTSSSLRSLCPHPLCNQYLLLSLQLCHELQWDIQRASYNIRRRERQPLRQTDVGHAIAFVEFEPDESFIFGRVFDVVA